MKDKLKKCEIVIIILLIFCVSLYNIYSFAYINSIGNFDNVLTYKTEIPVNNKMFRTTGNATITLNSSNVLNYTESDIGIVETNSAQINVSLTNDENTPFECKYDLYYYDTGDKYVKSKYNGSENEMEIVVGNNGFDKVIDYKRIVNKGKTKLKSELIINNTIGTVNDTLTLTINFRNVGGYQNGNYNRNYLGYIVIENVVCGPPKPVMFDTEDEKTIITYAQSEGLIDGNDDLELIDFVDLRNHPVPTDFLTVDYSLNKDNSVVGWIENETELYIGGIGGVQANSSLSYAFFDDNSTYNISNIYMQNLDTTNVTYMSYMFEKMGNLTSVILGQNWIMNSNVDT